MTVTTAIPGSCYWVHLWHEIEPLGGGFLITPDYVLTAAHCLRRLPPGQDKISVAVPGHTSFDGRVVEVVARADLALIEVTEGIDDVATLHTDRCTADDPWFAPYRPSDSDAHLAGSVTTGSMAYACEGGDTIRALQLNTFQALADYAGYSGGPIERRRADTEPRVVGLLIEQYYERDGGRRASNVLFAAAIGYALAQFRRFRLDHLRAALFDDEEPAAAGEHTDAGPDRLGAALSTGEQILSFIQAMAGSGRLETSAVGPAQLAVIERLVAEGFAA